MWVCVCACDRLAIRDHFHETVSDLVCEKGPLLKHLKETVLYTYSCYISTTICMYTKLFSEMFY